MNFTPRMLRLLGEMRRERNGEVVAAMRYYGADYGLNYGVSLPTVRTLARAEPPDHEFAKYLYQQDVRELRLAALHIAEPARLCKGEFSFWGAGIINSEVAEEAAFSLLPAVDVLPALSEVWGATENPLLAYALLLAEARSTQLTDRAIEPAIGALRRFPEDHCVAKGVVALLAALAQKEAYRPAVIGAIGTLDVSPSEDFVREEIAWRLEV